MKPSGIHSSKSSDPAPQGVSSRASTLQSTNVTLDTNTPPPNVLRENSRAPETKKMDIYGTSAQSERSPTILTERVITTAGGAPLVDMEGR
jgi:hypothetical protein